MHDVMNNVPEKTIKCLDKGFVTLVDVMPRLVPEDQMTADYAVVQAARVSYGQGTKTVNEDKGLIRYLLRHNHSTPLEMIEFKFNCKLPIFVARQKIRTRTASVNEISGRYSTLEDDFYIPSNEEIREQSKINKQGGDIGIDDEKSQNFINNLKGICENSYGFYEKFIEQGISKEQARMILPVNLYTSWYWKIDCWNLLHFLSLRCDSHAQKEIQVFANAMLVLVKPIIPWIIEAWEDYHPLRGAIKLTKLEVEAINKSLIGQKVIRLESENKREQTEWIEKAQKLGLIVE